jgi:septal ring factor EnvC (AmiA/AmiB activator)
VVDLGVAFDIGAVTSYEFGVAKKSESSRVPSAVGAIPVVGGLVKSADAQAQWMQDMLEQNARLVAQFPETMKAFNDSLERFNQTIGRLDRSVQRMETTAKLLQGTVDRIMGILGDLPGARIVRRMTSGRPDDDASGPRPKPSAGGNAQGSR